MTAKGPWAPARGGTGQVPCNYMQRLTILDECDALVATEEAIWSSNPQEVELGRKLRPLTGQGHFLDTAVRIGKEN